MSVQASGRSDYGSIEDSEQVDYEDDEQVVDEQVAEKQVGKQASKGPKSSPKHVRFAKDKSDCEGFEDGSASSEEEKPSSPLKLQRRKKRSMAEQRADGSRAQGVY